MSLYKKKKILNVYGILISFSIILIILSLFGFFKMLPIFEIFTMTIDKNIVDFKDNSSAFFSKFEQNEKLAKENIDMKKRIVSLESENAKFEDERKELNSLRNLNKNIIVHKDNVKARTTSVVFSDKVPIKLTIDKGSKDGINEGDIVINDTGSLIGKIDSISQFTATIEPYYISNTKYPIKSTSTQTALIDGLKDGYVKGEDLSQTSNVKVGDSFFTSALSDKMPEGVYIGKVTGVDPKDNKSFILDTDILNTDNLFVYL